MTIDNQTLITICAWLQMKGMSNEYVLKYRLYLGE